MTNLTYSTAKYREASLRSRLLSTLETLSDRVSLARRCMEAGNLPPYQFAQLGTEADILSRSLEELQTVLTGLEFENTINA